MISRFAQRTVIVTLCMSMLSVGAQPADSPTPNKPTVPDPSLERKAEKTTEQDRNKTLGRGKNSEDREIFRPSEEISEDFAVPFPVDI